jgi:hypothetical protein
MKSEVRIVSPSLRLTVTIGLLLVVLVIFWSIWFKPEMSLILLSVAGTGAALGIIATLNRFDLYRYNRAIRQQDIRLKRAQADRAEMERFILAFPQSQRIVTALDAPVRVIEAITHPGATPALLPAPESSAVDLLAALDSVQRCLIVGATDTGKTTLLQHIITRRLQSSKVVVLDPHSYPDKWPGCTVVGASRNYHEIDRALTGLVQLMSKRYQDIGRGDIAEGRHPRLTILIDEWRAIVFNVKGASEAIKALLTESRKAAFSVFVATHSERVRALGIEGEGDLKDSFAVVRLSLINGQRLATIDTGNGEQAALLPGPYVGPVMESDDYLNLEVEPTPTEAFIIRLYEQGESYNEIARQVYGHTGGKQVDRIKQVIERFS